jgi:hypothetical protein
VNTVSRFVLSLPLSLSLSLACGCGDDRTATPPDPEPDAGGAELAFVADAPVAGPSIGLEADPDDATVLRVVARGLAPVQGVALRLAYDPAAIQMTALDASDGWPDARVALGRDASPGLFFGVLSAKGPFEGLDATDRELGRVQLAGPPGAETAITFDASRGAVMSPDGTEQPSVTWIGGRIVPR